GHRPDVCGHPLPKSVTRTRPPLRRVDAAGPGAPYAGSVTTTLRPDATGVDALRHHRRRHSPRLMDVLYVGCGLLYTLFLLAVMAARSPALLRWPLFLAVNVALAFAFVWRRRYPVLLVLAAGVGSVVATADGLLALALFAL